jgi:hypothetical protein
MSGNTAPGNFSFTSLSQGTSALVESGSSTYNGVTTPINLVSGFTQTLNLAVTGGPPVVTTTIQSVTSSTFSGAGANFSETVNAGGGSTEGSAVASLVGTSPRGSAEHLGTTPNALDTSSGLLSAVGGAAMHAMSFAVCVSKLIDMKSAILDQGL